MGSPLPMLITLGLYISFVNFIGPKFMENKKPMQLTGLIKLYNIMQMSCNGFLVIQSFRLVWFTNTYRYDCIEVDYSDSLLSKQKLDMVWLGYASRLLDLLDTVFFVLRKKTKQISFLHVYHHTIVFFFGWLVTKCLPGGQLAFFATVNSFVHAVMYGYYLVTSLDPQNKRNLWWKKYITQLQLFQFFIVAIHLSFQLQAKNCNYPQFLLYFAFSQTIVMLILFFNFYRKAYWDKPFKPKLQ